MAQREALSQVRISVRNLVEFVMRSGDLDDRRMAGAKKEAMQAGSRPAPEDPAQDGLGLSGRGKLKAYSKRGFV